MGLLSKLLKFNADGNQLTTLPATLSSLQLLRDLSVARNKLMQVEQDCLCNLTGLVMLDLH